jgi:hypothetical protein
MDGSPGQHHWKVGTALLGGRFQTMRLIENQFASAETRISLYDEQPQFPYIQEVRPDGTATLTGIPVGFSGYLFLFHEGFVLKDGGNSGLRYKVDSAEPVKQKLVVIPAKNRPGK